MPCCIVKTNAQQNFLQRAKQHLPQKLQYFLTNLLHELRSEEEEGNASLHYNKMISQGISQGLFALKSLQDQKLSIKNEKTAQGESFRAGYPANAPGSFVPTSPVKNFCQILETSEKQAFGCGHPWPKEVQKFVRAEKLRTDSSFPLTSKILHKHASRLA